MSESDILAPLRPDYQLNYTASPTLAQFHASNKFLRGVRGPIGSGKSVGMCVEIFAKMQAQAKGSDGKRRTRWAIVRNTNPQLETTTIKTWLDWFPERFFGKFVRKVPYCHYIKYGDIEAEVYFLALDRPDDMKKLLSLELTGFFVNEAREVPFEVITTLCDRVGRYPSKRDGVGPTWYGGIMDTNAPDDDHWWAIYEGRTPPPDGWMPPDNVEIFVQPPAAFETKEGGRSRFELNPDAENLDNLPKDYYKNLLSGKTIRHIRIYVCNQFGTDLGGQPVYADEWNEAVHLAKQPLPYIQGCILHVGLDFGNTPSAVFSQLTPKGQWQDIHELVCNGVGAERFAKLLSLELARVPNITPNAIQSLVKFWGDPAGQSKLQGQERTYFDILRAAGIKVNAPPGLRNNDPSIRREAGASSLTRMVEGEPAYLLSPTCKYLLKGFNGMYRYRRLQVSGDARFDEVAEKNMYSHPHEARQYAYIGGGEARRLVGKNQHSERKVVYAKIGFDPHVRR